MADIGRWLRAFGGPVDGGSVYFPAGEEHLPVSCMSKSDPVSMYRVGSSLMDWRGILIGHYVRDENRATFLDLPRSVRGFYTTWNQDGDDGN